MDEREQDLANEQRMMRMMRKTLTSIVRDCAPKNGYNSPLTEPTQLLIKDCLVVISARETELARMTGLDLDEKPRFADEPATAQKVTIGGLTKKPH